MYAYIVFFNILYAFVSQGTSVQRKREEEKAVLQELFHLNDKTCYSFSVFSRLLVFMSPCLLANTIKTRHSL